MVAGVIVAAAACAGAPDSSAIIVAIGVARATHKRTCAVRKAPPWYECVTTRRRSVRWTGSRPAAEPIDGLRAVDLGVLTGVGPTRGSGERRDRPGRRSADGVLGALLLSPVSWRDRR